MNSEELSPITGHAQFKKHLSTICFLLGKPKFCQLCEQATKSAKRVIFD